MGILYVYVNHKIEFSHHFQKIIYILKMLNIFPQEIILHIRSYTYSFQNKQLLEDIINFYETKLLVTEYYKTIWVFALSEQNAIAFNPDDWLINDVMSYMNDYKASMYGYVKAFYNIFRRFPFVQKKIKIINKYISAFEKKDSKTQFNIVWGLLYPYERNIFCEEITRNITDCP